MPKRNSYTILLIGTLTNFYKLLKYAPTMYVCVYVCIYVCIYVYLCMWYAKFLSDEVWRTTGRADPQVDNISLPYLKIKEPQTGIIFNCHTCCCVFYWEEPWQPLVTKNSLLQ